MIGMERGRVLISGFEPFDGETVNVSGLVARALEGTDVHGVRVHGLELPCEFGRSLGVLDEALRRLRPRWVLAMGQAAGRAALSLERVAVNLDDARIPDNAGQAPVDTPVVAGAPASYFATLPVKAMLEALEAAGVPAQLSSSAGHFVCNHVFFGLQHRLRRSRTRSGFMHLPALPEQAVRHPQWPVMPLEQQILGVQTALAAMVRHGDAPDLCRARGDTC